MSLRRVANIGLDGTTVTFTIGKTEIRVIKATYADLLEPAFLSNMGSQEQDEQSPGTYKTEQGSVTMSAVRFRTEFMPRMAKVGGGNKQVSVVVGRQHPELGDDSDLLKNCRFTNLAAAVENSNKVEEVELKFTIQQIFWTDERKTINQLAGTTSGELSF